MNKIMIAFTAGVILGLLYAPAKGVDSRNKLANLGNDLKEGWNDLADSLAGKIDSFKESVDKVADSAVEKVESTQFETRVV